MVEKVIQIDGEKSGRQNVVSKSRIIDNEPKTSDIVSQETPSPVQELIKVLTVALQTDKKKASQWKGKFLNKQAGAGSAQLAPSLGNTQVKSRVDRATTRCNKCSVIGYFARECPSDKYLNSIRGVEQATPQNQGQQGQTQMLPHLCPGCRQWTNLFQPRGRGPHNNREPQVSRGVKRVKKENKGKEVSHNSKREPGKGKSLEKERR